MIIEFLGCPRSGKTTTAARVFANLKEAGFNCEYIPEQARFYIAQKRVNAGLKPEESLTLDDEDQKNILQKQVIAIHLMLASCGKDAIIVTDSSPYNSLLYMTPEGRSKEIVKNIIKSIKDLPTIKFYSLPVEWLGGLDPNRIHNQEQSLKINEDIVTTILPMLKDEPVKLLGDSDTRWRSATSEVLRTIMSR